MMTDDIVLMQNISKSFGIVKALDRVSINIQKNEILSLLGENGAGKTTLMNILFGLYTKDDGEIIINRKKFEFNSPSESIQAGIGMIHQRFTLFKQFTALENIILGLKELKIFLNKKEILTKVSNLSKELNLGLEEKLDIPIYKLSVGDQQKTEILKCLIKNPQIIILDEPDRLLTESEIQHFYYWLRTMTKKGRTIILITHKVMTALEVSDRIAVMEKGRLTGILQAKEATLEKLISLMFGKFTSQELHKKEKTVKKTKILEIKDLTVFDDRGLKIVNNASLYINSREIVGLAGIEGNGQSEIAEAILKLRSIETGTISYDGKTITELDTKELQRRGITLFGAQHMLVEDFSIKYNSILDYPENQEFSKNMVLKWKNILKHAQKIVRNYDVRCPTVEIPAAKLSGGNKQRLVMGRKLEGMPKLLIALNPAKDLDYQSTNFLYNKFIEFKNLGGAVFFISVDLDAIINLCDRVYIISRGKIIGEFSELSQKSKQEIGLLMAEVLK